MPLATLSDVKSYLRITDNSDDSFLNMLIINVQAVIETYCNRHFDINTYTAEQHIINHKIFTNEYPIVSVQNIVRVGDDIFIPSDSNSALNYRIFPTYIDLLDYKDVTMSNRLKYANIEESYVEVTYTAGYTNMPLDLTLAAIKLIAVEYKESREDRLGIDSIREGSIQSVYLKKDSEMPLAISSILDRYRKMRTWF